MAFKKIKDYTGLVRDTSTNAIISTNTDAYYAAQLRKRKSRKESQEIKSLRQEVSELKLMLKTVINNINNNNASR